MFNLEEVFNTKMPRFHTLILCYFTKVYFE